MDSSTILMMVIVLGVLWGGFAGLLIRSMQVEKRRNKAGAGFPGGGGTPADTAGEFGDSNGK